MCFGARLVLCPHLILPSDIVGGGKGGGGGGELPLFIDTLPLPLCHSTSPLSDPFSNQMHFQLVEQCCMYTDQFALLSGDLFYPK